MLDAQDSRHMLRAVELAGRGLYSASPNPRVGCVLVLNEQVIGEGWHRRSGLGHAEVEALKNCTESARGATAYVTLEPCSFFGKTPPCSDALIEAGIQRLVVGSLDPNPKVDGLQQLKNAGITVITGCEEAACIALNPGFFSRMQRQRPWVRVKLAMSLDGRTALANGKSQWITGEQARADVQHWRAQADCILTGVGTVVDDNPQLTTRLTQQQYNEHGHGDLTQPMLAIVDSTRRIPSASRVFEADREVQLYSCSDPAGPDHYPSNCTVNKSTAGAQVSLSAMLTDLAGKEINEVHVEAGAGLCGSLIKEQLADELLLYIAPSLLGSDARGLVDLTGLTCMEERIEFDVSEMQQVGADIRLRLLPLYQLP